MAEAIFPATWEIPTDYTIRKCRVGLKGCDFKVYDAYGNLLHLIQCRSFSSSPRRVVTLLDADATTLITAVHLDDGWQGFKGYSWEPNDLLFTVHKLAYSTFKTELEVLVSSDNFRDEKQKFILKGSPFQRSCTIYSGDSIVAQANPLYKLKKFIYSRNKFRLTLYPGADHPLMLAMLVTYFGGN
ncbi:protein LURP-one-related 7 [Phalaenopsis equestris]|uniref:protein LURP-one-related 7 n=1 Tax=Phalaenopsis equestris TaxID=78828 RepID=UPI0009E4F891|nr:protein LURP-one-related 7 [Phalaenopsis equestris]